MKKLTALALFITILSFTSCEKKSVEPSSTSTGGSTTAPESIKVQYRVTSTSGHFNVEYTSFEDDKVKTTSAEVNKIAFTYSFNWTVKQKLSIKAYNSSPSSKEILVEIYVNDVLFKTASANAPGAIAVAEAVYDK